jgi:hypothetical protein
MAKVILEFDAVEEALEARTAIDGSKWKSLVWDLDQKLRNTIKYESSVIEAKDKPATEVEILIAEQYREIIQELINDYGLNLE